ncbi:ABC transporter ATP-binding protein [Paraburkholderia gardini]|uniref:High-affinity branched-chain amino acid transport ATP-binding protein LivF n=1 Tax=Paraburkholderia gardini TaxID=2823469 RepID=A0ABM8U534_9BURK|nr:ABC transporter ATP-binding protein [Paraburkholderia gardini]CAG4904036.1 High-affinity branched-chain amino acid transport ATP-binding protein LivF [Paraburkholderia gardini]CAG4906746.1 High-affinity branched-chain amino acid transport ATP-binding protein LivF [Paraburkholderia gardini]
MGLLEIRDLQVSYGNVEVLHGISLDVAGGEIVALLGSNGAGKTTTLRAISGLIRPRAGQITLDGHPLIGMRAHQIVALGLGHAPEGRRMFGSLTVEENLRLGGYLIRGDRAVLDQRMAGVYQTFPRLGERRSQLAGTLSGGEQQMLAIARALMLRPRIVVLDEPSMGLAPKLVRVIFGMISDICADGTSVLLVEQNARQALRIAHRAYVLESGRIALAGPAHELARDSRVRAAYLGGSAVATD